MPGVAKRKPPAPDKGPEDPKKPSIRTGVPLYVYLPADLRAAIDEAATRGRRSLTSEVAIALEYYLSSIGLWPPSAQEGKP